MCGPSVSVALLDKESLDVTGKLFAVFFCRDFRSICSFRKLKYLNDAHQEVSKLMRFVWMRFLFLICFIGLHTYSVSENICDSECS